MERVSQELEPSQPGQLLAYTLVKALNFSHELPASLEPFLHTSSICLVRKNERSALKTLIDEVALDVVCIIDHLDPSPVQPVTRAQILSVAQEALSLEGNSMPSGPRAVRVTFVELSTEPIRGADTERLHALRYNTPGARILIEALHVDVARGDVWSSEDVESFSAADSSARSTLDWRDILGGIFRSQVQEPEDVTLLKKPKLTYTLLGALIFAFALECWAARSFSPSAQMLFALGGSSRAGVAEGEWFRLLTATLLHGDVIHLLFNGITLWVGGIFVEAFIGKRWLLTIYTASAITGSLLGLVLNNPHVVSVGASGAIMGVLAAGFVLSFRLPKGPARLDAQFTLGRILLPSMIPVFTHSGEKTIDVAAHIGGAIGGAIVAALVTMLWSERNARPLPRTAWALSAISSILLITAATFSVLGFTARADVARLDASTLLVKDNVIPENVSEAAKTVDVWGKGHDRDPRVRYYRAIKHYNESDLKSAERELQRGLGETSILKAFFDRKLEVTMRTLLVEILRAEEKFDEARREASPVCNAGAGGTVPPQLARMGVCGPR